MVKHRKSKWLSKNTVKNSLLLVRLSMSSLTYVKPSSLYRSSILTVFSTSLSDCVPSFDLENLWSWELWDSSKNTFPALSENCCWEKSHIRSWHQFHMFARLHNLHCIFRWSSLVIITIWGGMTTKSSPNDVRMWHKKSSTTTRSQAGTTISTIAVRSF